MSRSAVIVSNCIGSRPPVGIVGKQNHTRYGFYPMYFFIQLFLKNFYQLTDRYSTFLRKNQIFSLALIAQPQMGADLTLLNASVISFQPDDQKGSSGRVKLLQELILSFRKIKRMSILPR